MNHSIMSYFVSVYTVKDFMKGGILMMVQFELFLCADFYENLKLAGNLTYISKIFITLF